MLYAGAGNGVFRSADGGGSWSQTNNSPTNGLNALVFSLIVYRSPLTKATEFVYAGTYGGGVYRSMDGGQNWYPYFFGPTSKSNHVYALALGADGTLYAGTEGGVFTDNNSGSWTPLNNGLMTVNTLVSSLAIPHTPAASTTLYAGTGGAGVLKSTDGGATWSAVNTGLPQHTQDITTAYTAIYALAVDPVDPATLYAGTDDGVFKSSDGGGTWSAFNAGLTYLYVESLVIDSSSPAVLFAGTGGGGLFRTDQAIFLPLLRR